MTNRSLEVNRRTILGSGSPLNFHQRSEGVWLT